MSRRIETKYMTSQQAEIFRQDRRDEAQGRAQNERRRLVPMTPWPWLGQNEEQLAERNARGLKADLKRSIHPNPNRARNRRRQDRQVGNRIARAAAKSTAAMSTGQSKKG